LPLCSTPLPLLLRLRVTAADKSSTMTSTVSPLMFPHSMLTWIIGTPNNSSIKLLTKEVYSNARAIPSTHGGGTRGHLGLVMSDAEYVILTGVQFQLPAHPGPTPQHATGANAAACAETTRLYGVALKELATATTVQEEIKKQILAAVDHIYLATLDNDVFGFADISVTTMLTHLCTTYGPITRAKLKRNRASIATIWNPDDPIKTLWERLREIQRISVAGNDPLSNTAITELTFDMFEATGIFTTGCDSWRIFPVANQTLDDFCTPFTCENKDHLRKLTMSQAGFHHANATTTTANAAPTTNAANAATNTKATT